MSPAKIILSEVGCIFVILLSSLLGYLMSGPWPTHKELITNIAAGGLLGLGVTLFIQIRIIKKAKTTYSILNLVGIYTIGLVLFSVAVFILAKVLG